MVSNTKEQALEAAIEQALTGQCLETLGNGIGEGLPSTPYPTMVLYWGKPAILTNSTPSISGCSGSFSKPPVLWSWPNSSSITPRLATQGTRALRSHH